MLKNDRIQMISFFDQQSNHIEELELDTERKRIRIDTGRFVVLVAPSTILPSN